MEFTKDEFFAYLLLYAAKADMIEEPEQTEFILSKVPKSTYSSIHKVFDKDTDQQRLDRILDNVRSHNYAHSTPEDLLQEIEQIMKSDGVFDAAERSVFVGIRRLFKNL